MSEKKPYSDPRFWEPPAVKVISQRELTPEEQEEQDRFDQEVAKLLAEGKIKFLKDNEEKHLCR